MADVKVEISYTEQLRSITVDGRPSAHLSAILDKTIPEWFAPSGEDGAADEWDGLIWEIEKIAGGGDIHMHFAFHGLQEDRQEFLKYAAEWRFGEKDDSRAAARYREETGNPSDAAAWYMLGSSYYYGRGAPEDEHAAVIWYEKAAQSGHAGAQYMLGQCYFYGQGVSRDYEKAAHWYEPAAQQGQADAQCMLGSCYEKLGDFQSAAVWYEKAARQDDGTAQYNLARCYEDGRGTAQDDGMAFKWYEKAAQHGQHSALIRAGQIRKRLEQRSEFTSG